MAATNVQAFSGDLDIAGAITSNLEVGTANLFVDTVNSRVGIGSTNPSRPLEIAGTGGSAIINLKRTDGGTGQGGIAFSNYLSNVCASISAARSGTEGGELIFYTAPDDTTQTSDNPYQINERMRIDKDGNVGIGTDSLAARFHIYGNDDTQPTFYSYSRDTTDNSFNSEILQRGIDFNENDPLFLFRMSEYNETTDRPGFEIRGKADSTFFSVRQNGEVGIGSNPFTNFVVGGTACPFAVNTSGTAGFCHIGNQSSSNNTLVVGSLGTVVIACDTNNNSSSKYIDLRDGTSTNGGTLLFRSEVNGNFSYRNLHVNDSYDMYFGARSRQMINLYGSNYGIGIQTSTEYFRTEPNGNHIFFRGGSHNNSEGNAGGGSVRLWIHRNNWIYNYSYAYNALNLGWSGHSGFDTNITLQGPNQVYYQARSRGWNTYSSRKLKENFEPVLDSLEKVKALNGVYYTWKQGQGDNLPPPDNYDQTPTVGPKKHIGFIADEIAEVLPWVCTFDEDGVANGLDYGAITPVLANAIKELDEKIAKSEASSDDRLKDNEVYVRNATETLMKLKPQIYDKKESLTSNVYHHEAGLIAQDIWYDAPELRFAVKPGLLSEIPLEAPVRSDDPREDPDYSKWGPNPASVDYNYLIPYTIRSIQEIVTDLPRQKTQVIGITPSNLNDTRGLVVVSDTNDFQKGVPKLSLSTNSYDKKCFGVISHSNTYSIDNEILIDTRGTGHVWVINTGNIESGDYLTTSNITGYAMKQDDDLLHSYTLAKSTIDCDFNPTHKPIKRVKQELKDVTYYIKTKLYEITKEQYDSMDDMYRTSNVYSFYAKNEYTQVTEKGGYDKMEYYKTHEESIEEQPKIKTVKTIISVDDWNSLESNVQNTYSPYYSNLVTTEVSLEDYTTLDDVEKAKCTFTTRTIYSYKVREETKDPLPGFEPEVRQEYVNVLDENGQLQWEDTQQTEASYEIRYLDANGNITDESNVVHIAALIGCKFC